ncbi:MAG: VOC family protein [Treponema sp.]|jgi:lactoylglutathione lyase|nr:VOC family protein [Treponema sp.]
MKITGVDHITINCTDTKKAFDFYENILELKKLETVDLGDHVLYYYALPGVKLELIGYKNPQKEWKTGNTDVGIYRHMALVVDDLDGLYERCKQAGVRINLEPEYIPGIKKKVMLIVDPDGVEIEAIQG